MEPTTPVKSNCPKPVPGILIATGTHPVGYSGPGTINTLNYYYDAESGNTYADFDTGWNTFNHIKADSPEQALDYLKTHPHNARITVTREYPNPPTRHPSTKPTTNKYIERIVFMQSEEDASEPLRILNDEGPDAVIAHLAKWHYPGEHPTYGLHSQAGAGDDTHTNANGYILSWNTRLGYIGLEYDKQLDQTLN